jgi:hypothetical protein
MIPRLAPTLFPPLSSESSDRTDPKPYGPVSDDTAPTCTAQQYLPRLTQLQLKLNPHQTLMISSICPPHQNPLEVVVAYRNLCSFYIPCMTCCRSYSYRKNDLSFPKQTVVGYLETSGSFVLPAFARMCLIDISGNRSDRLMHSTRVRWICMRMYEDELY